MKYKILQVTLLFIGAILIGAAIAIAKARAADYSEQYHYQQPPPPVIAVPPAAVLEPQGPCRVVRETEHDDILDTNDWIEREECP